MSDRNSSQSGRPFDSAQGRQRGSEATQAPSFLDWRLALSGVEGPAGPVGLWCDGAVLAAHVEGAFTRAARRRGLLGRERLDRGSALILAPCPAVHTVGMRFPIDVVFASRNGHVIKTCRSLRPWRIAGALGAYAVIEMAEGSVERLDVRVGSRLALCPAEADGNRSSTHANTNLPSRQT